MFMYAQKNSENGQSGSYFDLHFSINAKALKFFHEIFRIIVELNFALNLLLGFFLICKKMAAGFVIFPGQFKKIWPPNFFKKY